MDLTFLNPKFHFTMHSPGGNNLYLKIFTTLIVGIAIGFTFSQLMHSTQSDVLMTMKPIKIPYLAPDNEPSNSLPTASEEKFVQNMRKNFTLENNFETEVAERLFKEVKVLCWILTGPQNHEKKAVHVKKTWGSRCNKLIFMSSKDDQNLGAINLNVKEGRGNLWNKTRQAFKYVYDHHFQEYDWFLKADDDTYVIMENLRAFLYAMSPEAPVYFGSKFKPHVRQGYMSGGAGYVLSKEALRRFVEDAYTNGTICRKTPGGAEDKEMGTCLQNVGVVAGDSRDEENHARFLPTHLYSHIIPKQKSSWYWRYIFYATEDGPSCCSDFIVSIHYVSPDDMYVMEFLVYKLRPFGIRPKYYELPEKKNMSALVAKWHDEKSDNPL